MRTLVVYFTRSGKTRTVAEKIAKELDSDIEEIIDNKNRKGIIGYAGGVINPRGPTTIRKMRTKPSDYDFVLIGTPIWWYTCAPAVTAYFKRYGKGIKKAAFFYTCDADKKIKAMFDMEEQLGRSPVSTIGFEKPKSDDPEVDKRIKRFIKKLTDGAGKKRRSGEA